MRLGEVKQKLDRVIDENNLLVINSEERYGGQVYVVKNAHSLFEALELLLTFSWNDVVSGDVQVVLDQYRPAANGEELTQDEFNKLKNYIDQVNNKFPLFYSVLDAVVDDQDEHAINIKLPESIRELKDVTAVNTRLERLFKKLNVDGQFEFRGFDKGTSWIIVVPIGVATYHLTIGALKIAQEILKTQGEYFKKEEARINYEASLSDRTSHSEEDFMSWQARYIDVVLDRKAKVLADSIELNGQSASEMQTKVIQATKDLIKEMEEGTEFHLSLNPPVYAKEQLGGLTIDYKKMKELSSKKSTNEVRQIEVSNDNPTDTN